VGNPDQIQSKKIPEGLTQTPFYLKTLIKSFRNKDSQELSNAQLPRGINPNPKTFYHTKGNQVEFGQTNPANNFFWGQKKAFQPFP